MDFVGFKAAIISLDAKLQDVTAGRVHIEQTRNSIDPPFIQLSICKNNKRKEKKIQHKYWEAGSILLQRKMSTHCVICKI